MDDGIAVTADHIVPGAVAHDPDKLFLHIRLLDSQPLIRAFGNGQDFHLYNTCIIPLFAK
jgi:hypothetical protein